MRDGTVGEVFESKCLCRRLILEQLSKIGLRDMGRDHRWLVTLSPACHEWRRFSGWYELR